MKNYLAIDTANEYLCIVANVEGKSVSRYLPDCAMKHSTALMTEVDSLLKENNITGLTAIWASLSDKEPEKIIEMMKPYIDTLYTVPLFGARALTPDQLADMARPHFENVYTANSVESAIDKAMENMGSGLLVFGSLYLASDSRKHLIT